MVFADHVIFLVLWAAVGLGALMTGMLTLSSLARRMSRPRAEVRPAQRELAPQRDRALTA